MMDAPIVSPGFIYLLGLVDKLEMFFLIIIAFAAMGVFLCAMIRHIEDMKPFFSWHAKAGVAVILMAGICAVLVPSRNTLIAMIATRYVTPANIEVAKEEARDFTTQIVDRIFRVIEKRSAVGEEKAK